MQYVLAFVSSASVVHSTGVLVSRNKLLPGGLVEYCEVSAFGLLCRVREGTKLALVDIHGRDQTETRNIASLRKRSAGYLLLHCKDSQVW